jgi:hypothetical protein
MGLHLCIIIIIIIIVDTSECTSCRTDAVPLFFWFPLVPDIFLGDAKFLFYSAIGGLFYMLNDGLFES